MTNTGRRFFSGNTLEQAVMQAASHYQIDPDEVAYRKIEKRHGFLKTRRGVVIDVDPDNPRRAIGHEVVAPAPVELEEPDPPEVAEPDEELFVLKAEDLGGESTGGDEFATSAELAPELEEPDSPEVAEPDEELFVLKAEDLGGESTGGDQFATSAELAPDPEEGQVAAPPEPLPEATGEMAEAAREAVEALLEVAGLDLSVEVLQGDGQLEIELSGAGQQELIADRGSLLLAIQHLLPRTIRGLTGRSVPCRVDSGNFHKMQEESLERLAHKIAAEVKQEQAPRSLDPMNPAERRIIHLSLAEDDEVVTESQGRGFFKRVSIRPARLRPRGFDRYNR